MEQYEIIQNEILSKIKERRIKQDIAKEVLAEMSGIDYHKTILPNTTF